MRAIWTGEIAFGLVTIPTKLYSGTRDLTPKFHLVHKACGTHVQTVRRCPNCQQDLAWADVDKAFEVTKGKDARFTKEELADVESGDGDENDSTKGIIEIVEFVEPDEVDLAYVEKSYWVGPSGKSAHSFALLRTVLDKSGRVAIAKVAIRTRTRLALLRPRNHLFSLDLLRFADELVLPTDIELPKTKVPSEKELKLAQTLVDQLTSKFDPEKHPDEYRARVAALVEEKVERQQTSSAATEVRGSKRAAEVIDLSELLRRSLANKTKPHQSKTTPRSTTKAAPRAAAPHPSRAQARTKRAS